MAANPAAIENPFFLLYPEWALLPVVILATLATIIASQAVITGAYSLTRQAIQLRILPRLDLRHTSADQKGQIYMPQVNVMLMIGVLVLVLLFGTSSSLATAYGIAVTGTMVVTASLAFIVVWKHWRWPVWAAALLMLPFSAHRSRLSGSKHDESSPGWICAVADGRLHDADHVHLGARHGDPCQKVPPR